ncbi:GlsB/YeaQ/YmgE family stress response membrane protein [Nonomuraea sp. JJY05]|uniref:GlsB/YeaQ/YmgE family stress response membrane protein n=1 Tax=Nonomuraea sp. JJY05 TaxID=3350255 RepID=UPI00373F3B6A
MAITGILSGLIIGIVIGALGRLVIPGRQRIPIWLTIAIGVVAALAGTAIATALGVADTGGVDWIELAVQVALAALGVSLMVGLYGGKRRRRQRQRR